MKPYLIRHTEDGPTVVVAESFAAAIKAFAEEMVAQQMVDGYSELEVDDPINWIEGVDLITDQSVIHQKINY